MRYAMNVGDAAVLQRENPGIWAMLVLPRLTREVANVEPGRFDGAAVLFRPSEDEPGIKAFCQVLRVRNKRSVLRMYESATGRGGWRRI